MAVAMTADILLLVLQCNPSWASEKIPARVSPLPLLEAPLLQAQTVSRHKRLGDLGSEPQGLEGIYYLCLLALNHPPCSQQANISLVHSSTDDGAVTALLALETLTNFSSSWSLAFLTLSFYIHGFLSLSSVLTSISCMPAFHPGSACTPCSPEPTSGHRHLIGMQQEVRVLSPFAKQSSKVSKMANYFSLEEYILQPLSCRAEIIHFQTSLRTKTHKSDFSPQWNSSILTNVFES